LESGFEQRWGEEMNMLEELELSEAKQSAGPEITEEEMQQTIINKQSEGYTVYRDTPRTLLLDLDSKEAIETYKRTLPVVSEVYEITVLDKWFSKNGNVHVHLQLDRALPTKERLGLQAMLGSDQMKEALGLRRYAYGIKFPSLLFKPKGAKKA
jgi:hypothetical protein